MARLTACNLAPEQREGDAKILDPQQVSTRIHAQCQSLHRACRQAAARQPVRDTSPEIACLEQLAIPTSVASSARRNRRPDCGADNAFGSDRGGLLELPPVAAPAAERVAMQQHDVLGVRKSVIERLERALFLERRDAPDRSGESTVRLPDAAQLPPGRASVQLPAPQ